MAEDEMFDYRAEMSYADFRMPEDEGQLNHVNEMARMLQQRHTQVLPACPLSRTEPSLRAAGSAGAEAARRFTSIRAREAQGIEHAFG